MAEAILSFGIFAYRTHIIAHFINSGYTIIVDHTAQLKIYGKELPMICKTLCLFLLLPVSALAMSESMLPELVMIHGVSVLEYDNISQAALLNKAWNNAVEKTFNYRREFISKCLRAEIETITHTQAFNERDLQWNNRGTACCFVDLTKSKYKHCVDGCINLRPDPFALWNLCDCPDNSVPSYPALFRVQLTKQKLTFPTKPITVSNCRIQDQDTRIDKQRLEDGFGLGRTYVFTPCIDNTPLDGTRLTCFLPFFDKKGDACVHTFRTTADHAIDKKEGIVAYTLSSKGEAGQRFCLVEKDGIISTLKIENDFSHFLAFQFATVEETKDFKTFVFDDVTKQKLSIVQAIIESIIALLAKE
jgi:hypothetical protein